MPFSSYFFNTDINSIRLVILGIIILLLPNVICCGQGCPNYPKDLFIFRVNIGCGPAEERVLLTGLHAVADIFCECCKTTLGWKYVSSSLVDHSLVKYFFVF